MDLILAIHPKWVEKIRKKEKSFELRKFFPKDIKIVYIYETNPIMKITAKFEIDYIIRDTPINIWNEIGNKTGCSYAEFFQYYNNKKNALAIKIKNLKEIHPIKFNGQKLFPQSYKIIKSIADIDNLH